MKIKGTILFLFFLSSLVFSQTVSYQGPDSGGVSSGVMVTTDNFSRVIPVGEPIERGIRNVVKPEYDESLAHLIPPAAPEGTNYFEDSNANISNRGSDAQTVLLKDFTGIGMGISIPPDPIMAVGPNHILACVNTNFAIWDKQGNLLKNISADQWYSSILPNSGAFDPQIIFDHYAGRWFMLWDHQNNTAHTAYFLISVSDDDDPTGVWYNYALPANVMGNDTVNTWGDYPQIGFDQEAIYINSRQFLFDCSQFCKVYDRIRILNKEEYYSANGEAVTWTDIYNISYPGSTSKPDVIHPSIMYNDTTNEHYFVNTIRSTNPPGPINFITLYRITDPITNPVLTGINIPVTSYYPSPDANQLGGGEYLIDAGGSSMKSSPVFRDGFLWVVHTVRNPTSTSNSSIRYYKIDVSNNSVVEEATFGASNNWYLYPNLTVDQGQNIAINYTKSSLTEYPGAYYTTRLSSDPPGLSGSTLLKPGLGNYVVDFGSQRNRWGDYHGIYLDPVTESNIWMFTEYAAATNQWGTWIGEIRLVPYTGAHIFTPIDELNFGNIEINFVSDTLSLVLANYGDEQLTITSIPDSVGPFKLLTPLTFPFNLASYDSLTLEFRFTPTLPGVYEETLNIVTNDPNFNGIGLSGRGYNINPAISDLMYASSGVNNEGKILNVNIVTGSGTELGVSLFSEIQSLAIHPETNILYGIVTSTNSAQLVRVNAPNGDAYVLHNIPVGNFTDICFDTIGTLYGILKTGEIYTLSINNGEATLLADANVNVSGASFNPVTNELWATPLIVIGSNKDRIFKIDLATGDTAIVGNTGINDNHNDIAFDGAGNLYAATGSATQTNNLIQINTSTAEGTIIGSIGFPNITGLAYLPSAITSVDGDNNSIPGKYTLQQNYPNPFNPSTSIEFTLPVQSSVKLTIYNILGEVVNILIDNQLSAGMHSINWNSDNKAGNKLVSGVYFFELKANGIDGSEFTDLKKMILLK